MIIINDRQEILEILEEYCYDLNSKIPIDSSEILQDLKTGIASALIKIENSYQVIYRHEEPDLQLSNFLDEKTIEDEMVEDEVIEDEVVEDEMVEDEMVEDEVIEDEVVEDEVVEDEVIEDEMVEDKIPATSLPEKFIIEGPIRSDDPDAIAKLKQQLEEGEALQEKMKRATKLAKQGNRQGLAALGYSENQIEELLNPKYGGRKGHQAWELSNNNQNLRRIRERIAELEARSDWETSSYDSDIEGLTIEENVEDNRIRLIFEAKPNATIRNICKVNGFKWSNLNKAWQRQLNEQGKFKVKCVIETIKQLDIAAA